MDFIITSDPFVIIVYSLQDFLIYYNWNSDEQWLIYGKCILKGNCIEGAVNPDTRPREERLDCPIRPEFKGCCDLRGVYL